MKPRAGRGSSWVVAGPGDSETMEIAGLERLRSREERFADHTRTGGHGQLAGVGIDLHEADAVGRLERDAGRAGERANHELGPDGQRGLSAREPERLVLVEAHPDDRHERGG